ncbi:MAG: tRNA (adenosine(37)-N6)-dimethylallyltransferase MiaA [Pseudomonadota bacterium]
MNRDRPGNPLALVIGGPTASGKSALALAVAQAFDGTIINADSMQLYRELRVLSAAPTAADLARAPHRLYGVLSAAQQGTVAGWLARARAEIARAQGQGRLPIVVGGTGMYLKALVAGLADHPPIPPELRRAACARHAAVGAAAFHAELTRLDPIMAARLSPGDTQRLIRAFEVVTATGRSLAEFQRRGDERPPVEFATIVLLPARDTVYAATDARCRRMMAEGALAEVRALIALDLDPGRPAMKAVGVRELARHIAGELNLEQAVALFQRATRNYAKRQLTWFRHQSPGARVWNAQFSESLEVEMFPFIRTMIDRAGASD